MMPIITILSVVIIISMVILSVLLYNFMLLISEMNKRVVYIVSDVLNSLGMTTPHLDTLFQNQEEEDILEDDFEEPFNPHNFDPLENIED